MFAKIPRLARSSPLAWEMLKCWETDSLVHFQIKIIKPKQIRSGVAWRGDTGTGRHLTRLLYSYDIFGNLEILTGNDTNLPSV